MLFQFQSVDCRTDFFHAPEEQFADQRPIAGSSGSLACSARRSLRWPLRC